MRRSKEATLRELELALSRIKHGRTKVVPKDKKLSISSVALEAGVSTALIFNEHKEFAQRIRDITNTPENMGKKQEMLSKAHEKIATLKIQINELESDLKKLAIENLSLSNQVTLLHSQKIRMVKK